MHYKVEQEQIKFCSDFLFLDSIMSYPGRPPIVPGIPIPPAMGIPRYMPPIMPPVMTMPPVSNIYEMRD